MDKARKLINQSGHEHCYHDIATEESDSPPHNTKPIYAKTADKRLYICIVLLVTGWLATILYNYRTRLGVQDLYKTPIPPDVFKLSKKVFNEDPRYVGWNHEVNANWDRLVAGHDAVWIEDPTAWGLPPGTEVPFNHPNMPNPKPHNHYVISSLHSLHCVNMIRFQYFLQKYDQNELEDPNYPHHFWDVHIDHCFEYLRQSISCGGDFLLEGASAIKINGGQVTSVTGWGSEHYCVDFDLLLNWVNEQEVMYNKTWQNP